MAEPLLRLEKLAKDFGSVTAVRPTTIDIDKGEFFALLGPSGCGKTTLLKMIGGFTQPQSGRILIEGEDVTRLGPEKRPVNTVFQGYGLFPHMTVPQNIGYGLKRQKVSGGELTDRVQEAIDLVRLGDFVNRAIDELSGGQQQRVALARALVMRPKILLLDEPLSALDLKLRQQMQRELRRIHDEIGGTFIVVTHDQGEALSLADNVAVMRQGSIEQIGDPAEVYDQPANQFVSTFIGEANLIPGRRENGCATLETGYSWNSDGEDEDLVCMIRPESIEFAQDKRSEIVVPARLVARTYQGATALLDFETAAGTDLRAVENHSTDKTRIAVGQDIELAWSKADMRIFPAEKNS
ncbi:MAG: ABC transporter ATP-binding protein [Rhodobacteraceae bacterium]|nr:ABC transporter ATP-binding protein [Paracoccaceae bacterium]